MRPQSRREFLQAVAAGAAALPALPSLLGCALPADSEGAASGGSARLTARPHAPNNATSSGTFEITPGAANDGALVVPAGYSPSKPMPFVLGLHGATMLASTQISLLAPYAQSRGFILLAVGARGITWDAMTTRYSYDVAFIDRALKWAFDQVVVDPARVVVEGFSDGASYALGLALANGDLFTRTVAFSAGYIPGSDSPPVGKSRIFESHGVNDQILPIDNAARRIVPMLKSRGYSVEYTEFVGGHTVPPDIAKAAVDFVMA